MSSTKPKKKEADSSLIELARECDARLESSTPGREQDRQLALAGGHLLWAMKRKRGEVYLFDSPKALHRICSKLIERGQRSLPSERSCQMLLRRFAQVVDDEIAALPKANADFSAEWEKDQGLQQRLNARGGLSRFFRSKEFVRDLPSLENLFKVSSLLEVKLQRLSGSKRATYSMESTLEGLLHLCLFSPCFLFFGDDLFVSRPPVELHLDYSGRINATDRPAVRFVDGFTVNVIAGVRVNDRFFSPKYSIKTKTVLDEENMEVRRVMMERMGIDTFLRGIEAREIASDDYGVLYQGRNARIHHQLYGLMEPLTYVRLLNSTPEPGTTDEYKEYLLRVPPDVKSPQEAVAWSFELEAEHYAPSQQT